MAPSPLPAAEVAPEMPADPAPPPPEEAKPEVTGAAVPLPEYLLQSNPLAGCTLCHVDVEDEYVGTVHFDEQVGCGTCHGPSKEHLADENNEVKPDEVFARENVDRLCEHCHECFRPKAEKPEVTGDGAPKVCTDCHGPHDTALASDATASGPP
ncbi:MAG: hypothetical protein ABIP48_21325 [Planctomycetota bacterium]